MENNKTKKCKDCRYYETCDFSDHFPKKRKDFCSDYKAIKKDSENIGKIYINCGSGCWIRSSKSYVITEEEIRKALKEINFLKRLSNEHLKKGVYYPPEKEARK